jgi:hypothetical protein
VDRKVGIAINKFISEIKSEESNLELIFIEKSHPTFNPMGNVNDARTEIKVANKDNSDKYKIGYWCKIEAEFQEN